MKTYTWSLHEVDGLLLLDYVLWTKDPISGDPCRADLTYSETFRGTRGAVAFTEDSKYLWTAGGRYDMETGHREAPPILFHDDDMLVCSLQLFPAKHERTISGSQHGCLCLCTIITTRTLSFQYYTVGGTF
jgi:hypothetical protein